MPSDKVLQEKKAIVKNLSEKLKNSCAGVVVSYKGINVEDDTVLRKNLRESGIEYMVTKNTLLRRAVDAAEISDLTEVLEGTKAVALSENDHVAAARILSKFSDSHDFFQIKAGFIDGNVITKDAVIKLAKLPSKEVLIAQVLGSLNAPITGLATVLKGNIRGLAIALNQIAQKKSA